MLLHAACGTASRDTCTAGGDTCTAGGDTCTAGGDLCTAGGDLSPLGATRLILLWRHVAAGFSEDFNIIWP